MPDLIREPSRIAAAGQPPKLIDEYSGELIAATVAPTRRVCL